MVLTETPKAPKMDVHSISPEMINLSNQMSFVTWKRGISHHCSMEPRRRLDDPSCLYRQLEEPMYVVAVEEQQCLSDAVRPEGGHSTSAQNHYLPL